MQGGELEVQAGLVVVDGQEQEVVGHQPPLGQGQVAVLPHRHHQVLLNLRAAQAEPARPWNGVPSSYARNKDYYITGRANVIFCAVGLR